MLKQSDLIEKLHQVHKKSYPAYKSLRGQYDWGRYVLSIDHVQGDPFASPSGISIHVPLKEAGFLPPYLDDSMMDELNATLALARSKGNFEDLARLFERAMFDSYSRIFHLA